MPMLMTLRMRLPVCPFHVSAANAVRKRSHLDRALREPAGTTSSPVDNDGFSFGRAQRHVQHRRDSR